MPCLIGPRSAQAATGAIGRADFGATPSGTRHAGHSNVNTFETLEVWLRSMQLAERVYHATSTFPRSELFGVTSQLRRAAVSIGSNIAEGHCRRTTKAYVNHVSIALGSNGEVATLLHLSARLGYLTPQQARSLASLNELVARLLYGLHRSLSATTPRT